VASGLGGPAGAPPSTLEAIELGGSGASLATATAAETTKITAKASRCFTFLI
jgi:hypothetical protein